jgi:predicted TIM-barrel fold metal-dependent hydrolase
MQAPRPSCPVSHLASSPPGDLEAKPLHDTLVAAHPDNLVWGTDWPHPRPEGPTPEAAHLLELFLAWTPLPGERQAILADNPARLYGFLS